MVPMPFSRVPGVVGPVVRGMALLGPPLLSPLLLTIGLAGCNDYAFQKDPGEAEDGRAAIALSPGWLSFGEVDGGETVSDLFTVTSEGSVALSIDRMYVGGSSAFSLAFPYGGFEDGTGLLLPGESQEVIVSYTPVTPDDTALVLVESSDPDHPEVAVTLDGRGLVPVLSVEPQVLDFGTVALGDTRVEEVVVANVGTAPLDVADVLFTGAGFSFAEADLTPLTLDPGDETVLTVTFPADVEGRYEGELWVTTSVGTVLVPVTAGAALLPVAVCGVTPEVAQSHLDNVTWLGHESYSPSGQEIATYEWNIVQRPTGSASSMNGSGPNRSFLPDLAGAYEAQLIVGTAEGLQSAPCTAILDTFPAQELWVELFWSHDSDDMDLHLVAPGGRVADDEDDCHWWNCVPTAPPLDWGVWGEELDNPALDFDDIPGTGPENINIWEPANGTYAVYVHDFPGHPYEGDNEVTVNVFVRGELAWTDTRTIAGEDDYVPFAEVDWPSGTITPL